MSNTRFDLEMAIASWRRFVRSAPAVSVEDADELESHLRDEIDALVQQGMAPEAAFERAVQQVGDYAMLERAYRRVYWKKVRSEHRIMDELRWRLSMFKNYLVIALRTLRKQKGFAALNVFGLATGVACCLLLLLYVQDELSYDHFWPNADRIYRVAINEVTPTSEALYPLTPRPLAAALVSDYPEVEQATRLGYRAALAVGYQDKLFDETRIHRADSSFFEVFSLPFVAGDPRTALKEPSSVVISASMARKYFGDEEPLGKVLDVKDGITYSTPYTVTGVVEDIPPDAHFHVDFLLSWWRASDQKRSSQNWLGYGVYTYFLLGKAHPPGALEAKFPDMVNRYAGPQIEEARGITFEEHQAAGNHYRYFLQPLTDIHLHSHTGWEIDPNGNSTYVYLFSVIAFFILLLACVNYMNLATARSAGRAIEVGMRKVLGSNRRQLVTQLLTESVLMAVLAFLVALLLLEGVKPAFNIFTGKALRMGYLDGIVVPVLLGFAVVVGVLSGSYPAFFLSRFRPIAVLKGTGTSGGRTKRAFRNGLVVFQFVISITLLVGTLVVHGQMDFMLGKELGFDQEHVVVLDKAWALGEQRAAFKQELLSHPNVVQVSVANALPGEAHSERFMAPEQAAQSEQHNVYVTSADHDYVQTLGLEMAQGRTFDEALATDSMAVLVNETLVHVMGLKGNPVGQYIRVYGSDHAFPIIGVVKGFHFQSLHAEIGPFAYFIEDGTMGRVAVRIRSDDVTETLAYLAATWEAFVPDKPFKYGFLEDSVAALYRAEEQTRALFSVFSILAIFIACLGLFGLAAYAAERRTKEIGVRKVLGASVTGIVVLLATDFLKLIGLAFVVAAPLAYLAMHRWLEDFAYHIALSWQVFLIAGLAVLLIALLTVSYQSIRAALTDPVNALRYE